MGIVWVAYIRCADIGGLTERARPNVTKALKRVLPRLACWLCDVALLHNLDSVAEGIINIKPPEPGQILIPCYRDIGSGKISGYIIEILRQKCRMGFAGGAKPSLNAKVKSDRPKRKPEAATRRQLRGFGQVFESQYVDVKPAGAVFLLCRHCQLHVMKGDQRDFYLDESII